VTSQLASPPPERGPWRPRDAAAVLGWWFVAGVVGYALVDAGGVSATELFGVVVPVQSLGAVGAVALLAKRRENWREALAVRIARSDWIGLLMGAGLQISMGIVLVVVVEQMLGRSLPEQEVVAAAGDALSALDRVLAVASLVFLGPLAEELVFRGVLLRSLLRGHGTSAAVWISAAAFAALHLLDPSAWLVTPLLLVLGVVLGYQTVTTGRLGRAVAMHAGFNLVTVVALFTVT